jgi:hypothetical protein
MSQELFEIIEQHNLDRLAESLSRGADPNAIQSEGMAGGRYSRPSSRDSAEWTKKN